MVETVHPCRVSAAILLSPGKKGLVTVHPKPRRKPVSTAPGALFSSKDRVPDTYTFAGREFGTLPGPHEYTHKALLARTTFEVDTLVLAVLIAALYGLFSPGV